MLYLGIDQHRKQLTVSVRNEAGDVTLRRQVSTEWERVRVFFDELRRLAEADSGFAAIVEVCGFNDWLLKMLVEYGCRDIVLIQVEKRSRTKTDRRDAHQLSSILWLNRHRLLAGQRVEGVRRIQPTTQQDAEDRQVTVLRKRLGQARTRTINKIKHVLRKHNLEQEQPAKGLDTKRTRKWLAKLPLGEIDRMELDLLMAQWKLCRFHGRHHRDSAAGADPRALPADPRLARHFPANSASPTSLNGCWPPWIALEPTRKTSSWNSPKVCWSAITRTSSPR